MRAKKVRSFDYFVERLQANNPSTVVVSALEYHKPVFAGRFGNLSDGASRDMFIGPIPDTIVYGLEYLVHYAGRTRKFREEASTSFENIHSTDDSRWRNIASIVLAGELRLNQLQKALPSTELCLMGSGMNPITPDELSELRSRALSLGVEPALNP